ncbi:MAG: cell surface protein SprA, partial [Gemmatimonadales bacterium]|nr:cell surface protein SprA [Gemmatimonadales bacterium]
MGGPRTAPHVRLAAFDSTVRATLEADRSDRLLGLRLRNLYAVADLVSADVDSAAPRPRNLLGLPTKYADLTLDGQARLEVRTDRVREERCTPSLSLDPTSGCRGGFKAPSLDNQVNIRSTGLLGQRVHVNVDFDTERDYSSNNNVQIYYEGLQDEIVRRVDVGTVVFQPPASRFITAAVPANNFGINATFEVGPVQLQTLAATQKGSVVAERTYTVGQTTSQAQDRQLRDLDFESGRFFWIVDPDSLPGSPALDILNLSADGLSPTYRPSQVRIYRHRTAGSKTGVNPNLGGITALARRGDSPQTFGPVRWELLIQGTDYSLDESGLWISLGTKLDQNDYLAVSYRTAADNLIGTFPEVDRGTVDVGGVPQALDTLELIVQPQQGPALPTFRYEMRQVYRVAGADLDAPSLEVGVTLNRSERPLGGNAETYLQQLGLAVPSDALGFDRVNRLFPRTQDPEAAQVIREAYIVFPHLRPFADPTRLTPAEASDSLYRTPLFLLLSQGPAAKFALRLQYDATGGGDRSTLSLNSLQLRDNSEQLFVGGRKLERGVDYSISYDVGQVTFLNPDALFGGGSAQVTARFEERGLFAVAPTTILGLATRYSLGDRGAINLIGLYQREQSAFTRPELGFEATANLIGGVNTELHFKPNWLTRAVNSLVTSASTAPSLFDLNAEVAFTKPDPNRSGEAYLEEFEGDAGLGVSLRESQWEFGSRPQQATGLEDIGFAGGFDNDDAVALTWQNLVPERGTNAVLERRPQDIDTLIRIAGRGEDPETIMYLTLHADTAGGIVQVNNASRWSLPRRDLRPRWRSMVTSLSPTGVDLSNNDFLEFWLIEEAGDSASVAGTRLVFDLGTVSEDAVALAPDTFAVAGADTLYTGRQYVGLGTLDTERTDIGIFNAETDDLGILGDRPAEIEEAGLGPVQELPLCSRSLTNSVPLFPWGDLSGRCSQGNGVLDTEDLNGDLGLDLTGANENVFRYVVDLAADSFFVRNGVSSTVDGQTTTWKLYRIPIRRPSAVLNTPTLRLAQHLRITFATPADAGQPDIVARLAMARLRFVGSPWTRRSETPILGLTGAVGQPHGEVGTSVVSTENRTDLGYESPPGIFDSRSRRGGDRETEGTQINEKSLRIIGQDLRLGERAEAYLRFPAGAQNLLTYRTLRVWMRGRGPGWEEGDLQAFLKLGSDNDNFYLYRAPARSSTWEPEFAIDLETLRRLRAEVENRWLTGQAPSGAAECGTEEAGAFVACEGPYLVHVRDPGINPPNLAAVQEISAGIFRVGETVTTPAVELWVDDVRLSEPVSQTGNAASVDARLSASDVGSFTMAYVRQNGQFRQINENPSYRGSNVLQVAGNLRLERFLPTGLGLAMPLTLSYARTGIDPELLTGSDIRGESLSGLRKPDARSATVALSVRRSRPGTSWITKGLIDPLSVAASVTRGRALTELSEARANSYALNLIYQLTVRRKGIRLPIGGIVKALPGFMRRGEIGRSLERADFSLAPTRLRLASGLNRDEANSTAFRFPVARSDDVAFRPTLSLNHLWRNSAGLTWQPLGMLNLSGDLTSTRDLRVYPDSSPIGRLAYSERRFLLGLPVGVERDRTLVTALSLTPNLASWLRPRFVSSSSFVLSRTLSSRDPVRADVDSGAFILPQTLNNARTNEIGAALDVARGLRILAGDSSGLGRALQRVRPVDVSTRLTRTSTYDLTAFDPGVKYQLSLGGLESFLVQEGEDARGVSESRTAQIASGADLPYGINFTISHALTRTTRLQRVGEGFIETETKQREFPVGSVRWSRTFRDGPLTILAVGTAFRHREGSSVQANRSGPAALTSIESSSITPDVQFGLRNGMAMTFGYNTLTQDNLSNGNETRLDQNDFTGAFNYGFRLPRSISKSRKQVRSSLTYLQTAAETCLQQGATTVCTLVSDVRRREVRGGLDTDLLQTLSGGLQVGYTVNDARHLSRRTSQISVIASFQLSLFAGD